MQLTFGSLPLHLTLVMNYIFDTNTNASCNNNTPHYNHGPTIVSNFTNIFKNIDATIQIYSLTIQESFTSFKKIKCIYNALITKIMDNFILVKLVEAFHCPQMFYQICFKIVISLWILQIFNVFHVYLENQSMLQLTNTCRMVQDYYPFYLQWSYCA